ncbi:MAG: ABC transporter ATP-binding protein [Deltaproteobacteria bacterium]|nr:ABC transporter ATP-binding protein [Deltaproteobacteria bacterium]
MDRLKQSLWRGKRRYYSEFCAVEDASFNIGRNETVGIIGSNGSGKSTLLKLINGILVPTGGGLEVNGRVTALLELGTGFNPEFTGRENVFMNAAIMGLSRKETESRFGDIEAFADIGRFIDQPVKTYSSGMYVRLAFSVAVHVSPEILLIDEALSVGDIRFRQKCMARIKEFCASGTVVFISHDMAAVKELCHRVIWIEAGRIQMDGEPKRVVDKYLQFMYDGVTGSDGHIAKTKDIVEVPSSPLKGFHPISGGTIESGDRRVIIETIRLRSGGRDQGVAHSGSPFEIGIVLHAHETIRNPIIGYIIKDRLGREILGDNTALMKNKLMPLEKNKRYVFSFKFGVWPNILSGEYTLSLAVADGTLDEHTICHWYQDASIIGSITMRNPAGLFSLPDTVVNLIEFDE